MTICAARREQNHAVPVASAERVIALTNHAIGLLKDSALVTVIGLQFGAVLTGTIITETIFAWPGLGRLLVQAIGFRDYPLVQGCILFILLHAARIVCQSVKVGRASERPSPATAASTFGELELWSVTIVPETSSPGRMISTATRKCSSPCCTCAISSSKAALISTLLPRCSMYAIVSWRASRVSMTSSSARTSFRC